MIRILLQTIKTSHGCCGGKNQAKYYVLLDVEITWTVETTPMPVYNILWHSEQFTKTLPMAKKYRKWEGSVKAMGLDNNEDFMNQLITLKLVDKKRKIV